MKGLFTVADFKEKAEKITNNKPLFEYYKHGAETEFTLELNENIYKQIYIIPRCLIDVSKINMSSNIFGIKMNFPVGISPSANQKQAHIDGEIGTALAAGKVGSIFILSSFSMTTIEDVAKAAPETVKWMQMYIYNDRYVCFLINFVNFD